jgi:hypothetical protein
MVRRDRPATRAHAVEASSANASTRKPASLRFYGALGFEQHGKLDFGDANVSLGLRETATGWS